MDQTTISIRSVASAGVIVREKLLITDVAMLEMLRIICARDSTPVVLKAQHMHSDGITSFTSTPFPIGPSANWQLEVEVEVNFDVRTIGQFFDCEFER
jgi:hypothetical protein